MGPLPAALLEDVAAGSSLEAAASPLPVAGGRDVSVEGFDGGGDSLHPTYVTRRSEVAKKPRT
jgi:hypothetical protein